jgi:arylsulfatase A-like enzyme
VVLTSDHGEQLGDRHMLGKRGFFPESYHVPCLVVDPSPEAATRRGHREHRFSENVDLLPTILEWLGRRVPAQCDGHSLLPMVRGAAIGVWRDRVFWEYDFRDAASGRAPERLGLRPHQCALAATLDDTHACVQFAGLPPLLFDHPSDALWSRNLAPRPESRDLLHARTHALLEWRLAHADRTLHG